MALSRGWRPAPFNNTPIRACICPWHAVRIFHLSHCTCAACSLARAYRAFDTRINPAGRPVALWALSEELPLVPSLEMPFLYVTRPSSFANLSAAHLSNGTTWKDMFTGKRGYRRIFVVLELEVQCTKWLLIIDFVYDRFHLAIFCFLWSDVERQLGIFNVITWNDGWVWSKGYRKKCKYTYIRIIFVSFFLYLICTL